MKIYRTRTGAKIECFRDPIGDVLILNRPLKNIQEEAIQEAGCILKDIASEADIQSKEEYIHFTDDLYLSAGILKTFLQAVSKTPDQPAVLAVPLNRSLDAIASSQVLTIQDDSVLFPVHYRIPQSTSAPTPIQIDIQDGYQLRKRLPTHVYPEGEIIHTVTDKSVIRIITPVHLHMANMLANLNRLAGMSPPGLVGWLFRLAKRLQSKKKKAERDDQPPEAHPKAPPKAFYKMLGKMNQIGKNCDIHPTAVIEGSVIGDNVRIGAMSYVQFSHIGDEADIGNGACVFSSVIGAQTQLVTREWVSMCVVYPNVFFAPRFIQFALVGRDAQVYPSMYTDYRLDGKPLMAPRDGTLADIGIPFMGPIIGHRAKVAGGLILAPCRMIPNGVTVYPNAQSVVAKIPEGLQEGDVIFAGPD